MDEPVLAALVEHVMPGDEVVSSLYRKTADGEWHPRERGTSRRGERQPSQDVAATSGRDRGLHVVGGDPDWAERLSVVPIPWSPT